MRRVGGGKATERNHRSMTDDSSQLSVHAGNSRADTRMCPADPAWTQTTMNTLCGFPRAADFVPDLSCPIPEVD